MEKSINTPSQRTMARAIASPQPATIDLMNHLKTWAGDNPHAAALCCFAIGFALGWRLKPW